MASAEEDNHVNYYRVEQALIFLEKNFLRQPQLEEVAEEVHLSVFHFQKIFTEWAGISPKKFLQFLTVTYLKNKLQESKNMLEAAQLAGLSSQSRVYDLFTTLEAVTPQEYKLHGQGIRICYGYHTTPFGNALIGVTTRGVCWLSFLQHDDTPANALAEMKAHWFNSEFSEDRMQTEQYLNQIFYKPSGSSSKIHVLVKGTNFQLKVWEALLNIPEGSVTTYQQIAESIAHPKALQAVGSAVGANHIAYLIPCHRVIRKDGILGDYRWSAARKKGIIGWEMARKS